LTLAKPMTPDEAFLADIIAHPDDDTPRLIYADWLDEHGQPERAEFIRTQIESAGLPEKSRRRTTLLRREADLLAEHQEEWTRLLREGVDDEAEDEMDNDDFVWRRGFVEKMTVYESEPFVENARTIFNSTPLLEIWFPDQEGYADLARCRYLQRLRVLDFTMSGLTSTFGPGVLLRSANLKNLVTLRLCGYDDNAHLDVAAIQDLVRTPHLKKLRHLDLSDNWFHNMGVIALCKAKCLAGLETLELEGVSMTDAGLAALAATPALAGLRSLNLKSNSFGEIGLRTLLDSPHLRGLTEIDLRDCQPAHDDDASAPPSPATLKALRQRFGKGVLL
jgi:uncharacterized protein (TIGR02996 family)